MVVVNSKAPFNSYSIPWIAPLTLDLYLKILSVKQWGIKYRFLSFWYESTFLPSLLLSFLFLYFLKLLVIFKELRLYYWRTEIKNPKKKYDKDPVIWIKDSCNFLARIWLKKREVENVWVGGRERFIGWRHICYLYLPTPPLGPLTQDQFLSGV